MRWGQGVLSSLMFLKILYLGLTRVASLPLLRIPVSREVEWEAQTAQSTFWMSADVMHRRKSLYDFSQKSCAVSCSVSKSVFCFVNVSVCMYMFVCVHMHACAGVQVTCMNV